MSLYGLSPVNQKTNIRPPDANPSNACNYPYRIGQLTIPYHLPLMAAHASTHPPCRTQCTMSSDVLVEVEGLARRYGHLEAVRDISFTIRQGQVLGFLGPNGAGKTTTMQILSGNLAPSGGRIRIAGYDLLDKHDDLRGYMNHYHAGSKYRLLQGAGERKNRLFEPMK